MKRTVLAAVTAALLAATSQLAFAGAQVITVPDDFVAALSDTRTAGHYEVVGSALHVYTDDATREAKVAEYVATTTTLAAVGEPALDYTNTSGGTPGAQLIVDFDADGSNDGILIGETVYGNDWWLSNGAKQFAKDGAPSHTAGFGSANHGTLDQWRAAFTTAKVTAFGFSLGSGVKGDGTLNAITFAGDRYTFAKAVVLTSKSECKDGGWTTSTKPVYKNQGDCVSSFSTSEVSSAGTGGPRALRDAGPPGPSPRGVRCA